MKLASAIWSDIYPFNEMGFTPFGAVNTPEQLKGADALVVWGGEDISPSLYNHVVNRRTGAGATPSKRDIIEWNLMKGAVDFGIPIIGICRGAQMLCALAGGSLYQHVDGHTGGNHGAIDKDYKVVNVSSLHHQMLNVDNTEHVIIQSSTEYRSGVYYAQKDESEDPPLVEPEFVYFPKVKGYAIQWHPEFMSINSDANQWLKEFIQNEFSIA